MSWLLLLISTRTDDNDDKEWCVSSQCELKKSWVDRTSKAELVSLSLGKRVCDIHWRLYHPHVTPLSSVKCASRWTHSGGNSRLKRLIGEVSYIRRIKTKAPTQNSREKQQHLQEIARYRNKRSSDTGLKKWKGNSITVKWTENIIFTEFTIRWEVVDATSTRRWKTLDMAQRQLKRHGDHPEGLIFIYLGNCQLKKRQHDS